MGNDGGSIPKRDDLIKTKGRKALLDDPRDKLRQLFYFCALSKEPLQQPVVSCPLGKLYNKEALISYLLEPPDASGGGESRYGNDGKAIVGHIRSLKDVTTLILTPNPAFKPDSASLDDPDNTNSDSAPFICPISLREMNGSTKFVYRRVGGAVLSESALKEMRKSVKNDDDEALYVCPVTGTKYSVKEEWVTINPSGAELEQVKEAWEAKKAKEKEEKKANKDKKRKLNGESKDKDSNTKKSKTTPATSSTNTHTSAPSVKSSMTVPSLPAKIAAQLAEQKKTVSPAIASLYAKKDDGTGKDKDGRSNWMTRGAFTRYA